MSSIPEMMHKPHKVGAAGEVVGGGEKAPVHTRGSARVSLDLHYPNPTEGVEQKSALTWENFWRVAPVTAGVVGGGGIPRAGRFAEKLLRFVGRDPKPVAPKLPGYNFQSIEERLELLVVDGSMRHHRLANAEDGLARIVAQVKAKKAAEEAFAKAAEQIAPLGKASYAIENPVTGQPDMITVSTQHAMDGIITTVRGNSGTLVSASKWNEPGGPLNREIALLRAYFQREINVPPVREAKELLPRSVSPVPTKELGSAGQGSAGKMAAAVQPEVRRFTVTNPVTRETEEVLYSVQSHPEEGVFVTVTGPESREFPHYLPPEFVGKMEEIEQKITHLYTMQFHAPR